MKKPNCFVVGTAKAGTTSLHRYLKSHPDIFFSPIKEPQYYAADIRGNTFSNRTKKTYALNVDKYFSQSPLEEKHIALIDNKIIYNQLYREAKDESVVGEISNAYLYSSVAAEKIYTDNPKSKIIIILREPTERAFSHWLMDLRDGIETERDFIKAIENDLANETRCWGNGHLYVDIGLYYEQVRRYIDIFPAQQLKICLYDDYKKDSEKFVTDICQFLGVSTADTIDTSKVHNKAQIPRYPLLYNFIRDIVYLPYVKQIFGLKIRTAIKSRFMSSKNIPEISNYEKEYMKRYFLDEVIKLESLIGKDLSAWK